MASNIPGCNCTECQKCKSPTVCAACKQCARCGQHKPGCPGCPAGKTGHMAKAKEKTYLSIIDQMLDSGYSDADMSDAAKRGDALADLTHDMAEDGAFNSHLTSSIHNAKKLSDDNILNDVVISENKAKSNKDGLQNAANESAICAAIDKLLKMGHSPARIASVLSKCAEIDLQQRTMGADYLNRRSNDLGMGYLKPNTYMPTQPDTYERERPKVGSAHIAQIGDDFLSIGESKFGGTPRVQKRALEISASKREEPKNNAPTIGRVPNPVIHRGASDATKTAAIHHRGSEFDAGSIAEQHVAGKPFEQIWREACQHAGLHIASKAFHEYINRAKAQGKKFASKDAEFLGTKLGFRDLEIAVPKPTLPRTAYDSGKQGGTAKDGNELMNEFELRASAPTDIELREDASLDIEIGNSEINL